MLLYFPPPMDVLNVKLHRKKLNEMEERKLPDTEFKPIVIRMLEKLKIQQHKKDIEIIKKKN